MLKWESRNAGIIYIYLLILMESRLAKAWSKWRDLTGVICDKKVPMKMKPDSDLTDIGVRLRNMAVKDEKRMVIIILVLPPVKFQSNCALPMPGTADGDAVSRCQVLGRAGSVHHGADQ